MNLLFLDAYFEPEIIAYTHLEKDLIQGLIEGNNYIQIICPIPTKGISNPVRDEYTGRKREELYDGRVKVRRFWAPRESKKTIFRAFRYFWCNLRSYQIGASAKSIDLVFSNSTPPTQGLLGTMIAKKLSKKYKRKIPFVYNLQDVFPDSLVNAGMTKQGSLLWKIGRKIEDYTYRNTDRIIAISEGFKRNIMAKGVPEDKITVVSNWIDITAVQPVEKESNALYDDFGIDRDKYIVVYAGNFGATQGADIVLEVAEKLKDMVDIQFVIFGGGVSFEDAKIRATSLPNVIIHGLLSQERVPEVYSLGDVALITCKPGTGNAGMPSKVWSIMACNTPIIASFDIDSDLADVLRLSGAGKCVQPGNVEVLAEAIEEMYIDRCSIGNKTLTDIRKYIIQNASKDVCVNKYVETIVPAAKHLGES